MDQENLYEEAGAECADLGTATPVWPRASTDKGQTASTLLMRADLLEHISRRERVNVRDKGGTPRNAYAVKSSLCEDYAAKFGPRR